MEAKNIDWAQIAREVGRTMTRENLAFELDMCPSNLQKTIFKGSEPRYSVGVALLDLYYHKCGKNETPYKK